MPINPLNFVSDPEDGRSEDFDTAVPENMIPAIDGDRKYLYGAPGMTEFSNTSYECFTSRNGELVCRLTMESPTGNWYDDVTGRNPTITTAGTVTQVSDGMQGSYSADFKSFIEVVMNLGNSYELKICKIQEEFIRWAYNKVCKPKIEEDELTEGLKQCIGKQVRYCLLNDKDNEITARIINILHSRVYFLDEQFWHTEDIGEIEILKVYD